VHGVIEGDELQIRPGGDCFSQSRFRKVRIAQIGLPEASLGKQGAIRLDVAQFQRLRLAPLTWANVFTFPTRREASWKPQLRSSAP